ncbi:MAG TPA: hypothetical protein VFS00_21880 [Polyangiaceae bacterium]|nr:hypothetical protein [Polyangiaceae bacterium]
MAGRCARVNERTITCGGDGQPARAFIDYVDVVSLGGGIGCARRHEGSWWCAGLGPGYEIKGVDPDVFQPRPSPVRALQGAKQVAFGGRHGCAIADGGGVACWGFNEAGQLGVETARACYFMKRSMHCLSEPRLVDGVSDALELALPAEASCARTARGEVLCWGKVARTSPAEPSACTDDDDAPCRPPPPARVAGLSGVIGLAAGDYFVCALRDDGRVACWGSNASGVLGAGFAGALSRTPVVVEGVDDVVRIAAGQANVCALRGDGRVRCWGSGRGGYLNAPASVYEVEGLDDVVELATKDGKACALRAGGQTMCWPTDPPVAAGGAGRRAVAAPAPPL